MKNISLSIRAIFNRDTILFDNPVLVNVANNLLTL